MIKIGPNELRSAKTFIKDFMCSDSQKFMNYDELLSIFENCSKSIRPEHDKPNDLRSLSYIDDMKSGKWNKDIILERTTYMGQRLITDGIHRGIAYLACIDAGVDEKVLPDLYIKEK